MHLTLVLLSQTAQQTGVCCACKWHSEFCSSIVPDTMQQRFAQLLNMLKTFRLACVQARSPTHLRAIRLHLPKRAKTPAPGCSRLQHSCCPSSCV